MLRHFGAPAILAVTLLACGGQQPAPEPRAGGEAAPPAADSAPPPAPLAAAPAPEPAVNPAPAPAAATPKPAVNPVPAAAKPEPAPVGKPALPPTGAALPSLADNGHAAVGADKCKMCHRVQFDSWSTSKHREKGLDCEGCHGNGGDYKTLTVMKVKASAIAAGLILPTADFCRGCHGAKADEALLPKAHAHKAR